MSIVLAHYYKKCCISYWSLYISIYLVQHVPTHYVEVMRPLKAPYAAQCEAKMSPRSHVMNVFFIYMLASAHV
jgi:hypothetical protein